MTVGYVMRVVQYYVYLCIELQFNLDIYYSNFSKYFYSKIFEYETNFEISFLKLQNNIGDK